MTDIFCSLFTDLFPSTTLGSRTTNNCSFSKLCLEKREILYVNEIVQESLIHIVRTNLFFYNHLHFSLHFKRLGDCQYINKTVSEKLIKIVSCRNQVTEAIQKTYLFSDMKI